ncbi:MAG: DUF2254 domain-containing protein [Polyangiaceae bacterium]
MRSAKKKRLQATWIGLRSSLWFVPALIVLSMVALAVGLVEVDLRLPKHALSGLALLFGASADGTREMLSAIGSAMITLAGVVFSITIVALSFTSSQYTSRVLRNFMRDRSNQVVLGAFVGIYAYCLVVLRTIRGGDTAPFVPSVATLVAMILAFVGIALLIHFIHHICSAIQATQILTAIREETSRTVDRLFPDELGETEEEDDDDPASAQAERAAAWETVAATKSGYLASFDGEALVALACELDAVVRVRIRVGEFVTAGAPLVSVAGNSELCEDAKSRIGEAFTIGNQRTAEQDPAFGIRQIVDIALKALSPGVNDPTTATMCLDHLGVLLVRLTRCKFPPRLRRFGGKLRLIAEELTFEWLLGLAIEEIRIAAANQSTVLDRLLTVLRLVAARTASASRLRSVAEHVSRVASSASKIQDAFARADVTRQAAAAMEDRHPPVHSNTR